MVSKEVIEAATTGKIHVEFTEIDLTRNGSQGDSATLQGRGYLVQGDKTLRFTFFPNEKTPPSPTYFHWHLTVAGNLIPEEAFFTAHCVAVDGVRWTIENILPDPNFGPGGYVVHARVLEARWEEALPDDLVGSPYGMMMYFLGNYDFEANEIVKTERSVGKEDSSRSLHLSAARIKDIPGLEMRVEKLEGYMVVHAWSVKPLSDKLQSAT